MLPIVEDVSLAEPPIEPMSFTGTGADYFRIWIVNLALTVVTLGVFSAWAKVRRLQYFYRDTRLAHADVMLAHQGLELAIRVRRRLHSRSIVAWAPDVTRAGL